ETELRAFAKVYVEVEKIRQAYEPRLKEAKNAQEGKQIETEAVLKMQGALTEQGLTPESYTQIFEIARADEGLRKRLVEIINEERKKWEGESVRIFSTRPFGCRASIAACPRLSPA